MEALKQPMITNECLSQLIKTLDPNPMSAQEYWKQVSETINNAVEQVLGKRPPFHIKPWFDAESEVSLDAKNGARASVLQAVT